MFKVDGGSSTINKQTYTVKKPALKPTDTNTNTNPQTNAAVFAKSNQTTQQANLLRFKLTAQFSPTAAKSTPTITPQEAQQKADEIINNNGGRDNLNTDGVGRDLADIARQNPADAWAITQAMLGDKIDEDDKGKIKENDKDEIAQQFTEALQDSEIATLSRDENGRNLLDRMQHHLLSGSVHGDERNTADRIQTELGKYRTFSDWHQGIDPNSELAYSVSYGTAFDTNASPEEAAAGLKTLNRMSPDISSDTQAFTDQLEAHKNDAEWIQKYFAALGSDKTAELIGNSATPSGYSNYLYGMNGSEEAAAQYTQNMATLRAAFNTLQQGGNFSQTDMNNLVNSMQERGFNPSVAIDVFGQASSAVQESFIRATMANGNDTLEAAGSYVLSQMPSYKQSQILGGLSQDQLNTFIQGAMSGQTDALDMRNYLATGIADKLVTFGGVEKILQKANGESIPYPPYSQMPFSPELQNRVFNATVNALNNSKAFENFKDNSAFKDELSRLFIRNGQDILKTQAPDGAFQDANFISGMTKFFELTLFSAKGGELRDELMQSVIKTMGNVGDAAKNPPLSQSDYENLHNGWSQQDHTEVMGGLLGMVWQAADNQKEYIQNEIMQDEARKKEMVGLFVGMAFSFLPGAGDVIGKIAGEGSTFLQQIPDKLIDFTWSQSKDQLKDGSQDFLLNLLKGMTNRDALTNVDVLIDKFRDVIVATNAALPNGETNELNLRSAFQSAFSFYRDLVELH